MNCNLALTNVRKWVGLLAFSITLLLANNAVSYAHEPYYDGRSDRFWTDERQLHQQTEKRALKEHQSQERFYYGNNSALRAHQRREREELRRHQWNENRRGDRYYRYDRNGYYW